MKFSALISVAGAATLAGERNLVGYTHQQYMAEFSKSYEPAEMFKRKAIFEANLAKIHAQNAQEDKSWFASVNQFSDMTNEEFGRLNRHYPHPANTFEAADLSAFSGADVPDAVDWRDTKGVVTKVKNQGSCGSCWAFSATETLESAYAMATGDAAPILSPQQIVSCAPNPDHCGGSGGCDGSTQPLAFNYTVTAGITTEADYPYTARTGTCSEAKIKPVVKNTGYTQLKVNDYTELITAVANVGPVSISVAAGGFGWQIYGGGVYSTGGDFVMDHAVQLVGYGEDKGKMYWTVRNSWGEGWGESGYIRLERFGEGNEPCGMDKNPADGDACAGDTTPREYCGLCGMLSSSSYPTGVTKA